MDVAVEYGKDHVRNMFIQDRRWKEEALTKCPQGKDVDEQVDATLDRLLVEFGREILKIVPGKVSTEVDARYSFDTKASVDKALHIIEVSGIVPSSFRVAADRRSCINNLESARRES